MYLGVFTEYSTQLWHASVDGHGDFGERLLDAEVNVTAETRRQRPLPVVVGRLIVHVVLERQPFERQPKYLKVLQLRGVRHRVHVVRVQRQRQVQLLDALAAGQHVQHAGRGRLVAVGQVQPEPAQPSQLAHPVQHAVRHVRARAQAQRLQPAGFFQTCVKNPCEISRF